MSWKSTWTYTKDAEVYDMDVVLAEQGEAEAFAEFQSIEMTQGTLGNPTLGKLQVSILWCRAHIQTTELEGRSGNLRQAGMAKAKDARQKSEAKGIQIPSHSKITLFSESA